MLQKLILAFLAAFCLTLAACKEEAVDPTDPPGATVKKGVAPQPDAEVAVIENADAGFGKIVIELYPNLAPKMVAQFKSLIKQGFYNGVAWHRVNPKTGVAQTGDENSKDGMFKGDATQRPPQVEAEFSDILYERGIVGAARRGAGGNFTEQQAYNTADTQFFIALRRVPQWDKKYTVFGKVIQGLNNADTLAGAPVAPGTERPLQRIAVKSITLEPRSNYVK
jgi:cyclophilin family peptidyl-prolyl cis-trans isomerase